MAEIRTKKGQVILCDDADFDMLSQSRWSITNGYALGTVVIDGQRKQMSMHRYLMGNPPGLIVDHINRIRHDNRRSNLRAVTKRENRMNAHGPAKMTTEVIPGKWCLLRGHDLIGIYDTYEQVKKAWRECWYGGTPSVTNTTIPVD